MIIQDIGRGRFLRLVLAVGVLLFLAAAYFGYVMPSKTEAETTQRTTEGEVAALRGKITNIRNELKEVQAQIPYVEMLKNQGLFQRQDRFYIIKKLEDLRKQTSISGFNFSVSNMETVTNADAEKMGGKLINSRITLSGIQFLFDTDLYKFLAILDSGFPGTSRIHSVSLELPREIDENVYSALRQRQPVSPFVASVVVDWTTLVDVPGMEDSSAAIAAENISPEMAAASGQQQIPLVSENAETAASPEIPDLSNGAMPNVIAPVPSEPQLIAPEVSP